MRMFVLNAKGESHHRFNGVTRTAEGGIASFHTTERSDLRSAYDADELPAQVDVRAIATSLEGIRSCASIVAAETIDWSRFRSRQPVTIPDIPPVDAFSFNEFGLQGQVTVYTF